MAKRTDKKTNPQAAVPNLGGRPPFYATPEELTDAAGRYFAFCIENERPFTVTGLALFLGFSSVQSLDDTAKRPGFSEPVRRAKLVVEMGYEERLSGANATGSIFALKNFGWRDKQEVEHTEIASLNQLIDAVEGKTHDAE